MLNNNLVFLQKISRTVRFYEHSKFIVLKSTTMLIKTSWTENRSSKFVNIFTGDTVSLVSVNGPLDIKMTSQRIDKSTLEVLFSNKNGKPSVENR